jgi:predicted branched-subunit amino acid permease
MRAALPFVLPSFALAVSFGVLARSLGWGPVAPIVFSLVAFSGSAQFAAAGVLGAGGGVVPAVGSAVLVNARFLLMGVAVAPSLIGGRLRRAAEGQAVIDASWALAQDSGRLDRERMLGATLPQWAGWQLGTVVGALGGESLGDPEALGLDVLFPVFFLALLLPELREPRARLVAALAVPVTLVLIPLAPAGLPVLAAGALALLGLRR